MIDINTDTACRNIVDITAPKTAYVASLIVIATDKHAKHMFWLQAIGLIETWLIK